MDFLNLAIGRLTLINVICGVSSNLFVKLTLSDVREIQPFSKLEQKQEWFLYQQKFIHLYGFETSKIELVIDTDSILSNKTKST